VPVWNTKEIFHIADFEVGRAPGTKLPRRAKTFERRDDGGEVGVPISLVQQIEIEMIRAEATEARLASTREAVPSYVMGAPEIRVRADRQLPG
jgi:hypothetical protein